MWLDNIKELKKKTGMSVRQIAEKTSLPERTINRIFSGDTDSPLMTTLIPIVNVLGGSLDEVFADTKAVVGTKTLVELQETIQSLQAEKDHLQAENTILEDKISSFTAEIEFLRLKLRHKEEELQAIYDFYNKHKKHATSCKLHVL